jgi:HAD superfamily hydrolase (TIGR01509 family)
MTCLRHDMFESDQYDMSNHQKYKCILFDCDGVLVDSVPITNQAILDMLEPLDFANEFKKVIDRYRGTPLQEAFRDLERMMGRPLPTGFIEQYRELTYERLKTDVQPIPGVRALLDSLDRPFCVASGGPVEKIEITLGTTQLLPYFKGRIFSSYVVQKWKPDPGLFLHAAEQMGFYPSECLVVEDSLDGVQAGISGGFDVIGFVPDRKPSRLNGLPTKIIHSMEELNKMLAP